MSDAMYKVGDVITMDGGPGKPDEEWEVTSVLRITSNAAVIHMERVLKFEPGYFRWTRLDGAETSSCKYSAKWYDTDPEIWTTDHGRYVRVNVEDAE
jgi:hypothetical protein